VIGEAQPVHPPPTVIPVLVYPDVREVVAWLGTAFGFAEQTRIGESHRAQMSIGEADSSSSRHPPPADQPAAAPACEQRSTQ
jgi:hypothetical protein